MRSKSAVGSVVANSSTNVPGNGSAKSISSPRLHLFRWPTNSGESFFLFFGSGMLFPCYSDGNF